MRSHTLTVAILLGLAVPLAAQGDNGFKKLTDALGMLAKSAAGPKGNLVVNGGFEEPVVQKGGYITVNSGQAFSGWQVVGTGGVSPISGDYASSGVRFVAHGGAQWLDMTGPGAYSGAGVQQTVATQPGASYELAFWVGNVVAGGFGTTSTVEVLVNGQSLGLAVNDRSIAGQQGWGLFKMPVTATGNSTTISFINRDPRNDNSNGLDDVSLVVVPAASATASTAPVLTESFESPATANYTTYRAGQSFTTGTNTWVVQSGSVDIANVQARREVVAADGNQTVDLAGSPGAGVIAATFPTAVEQAYSLTFQYARNNGLGNTPARAKVEVIGASTLLTADLLHEAASQPATANLPFNGNFVADGAMTTLRFTSLNDGNTGLTVDGISVLPMPAR